MMIKGKKKHSLRRSASSPALFTIQRVYDSSALLNSKPALIGISLVSIVLAALPSAKMPSGGANVFFNVRVLQIFT